MMEVIVDRTNVISNRFSYQQTRKVKQIIAWMSFQVVHPADGPVIAQAEEATTAVTTEHGVREAFEMATQISFLRNCR
jgi:hypothetical protein